MHTLDRLGRTVRDTLNLIHELAERGIGVRNLADPIKVDSSNPTDPMAQLAVVLLALFGQMERMYARERAAHARAVATAKGRRIGRPLLVDAAKLGYAAHLRDSGHTIAEIIAKTGITRSSLYRHLPPRAGSAITARGGATAGRRQPERQRNRDARRQSTLEDDSNVRPHSAVRPHYDASVLEVSTSKVCCGDAFTLLEQLPEDSVDLLITSPPYWGLRTYGLEHPDDLLDKHGRGVDPPDWEWYRDNGGVLGLEPYPEWYISHLVEIVERARPALKNSSSVWVNLGDTYFARWSSIRQHGRQGLGRDGRVRRRTPSGGVRHDKQLMLIPARFAIAMQEAGWILRNDVIWSKTNVAPRPERDRLRLAHEHFFHFVKRAPHSRPTYFYDLEGAEPGGLDVVTAAVSRGGDGHSATFPPELIEPRILSSCPAGGLVLDPFCGTGAALCSAAHTGRRAIGFDTVPAYASIAREKLQCSGPNMPTAIAG